MMEIVGSSAAELVGRIFSPFSGHNAMISLAPLSVLIGVAMLWTFGRTSNQNAILKIKSQLYACLYELRLFTDEPVLIWKAQWGLLTANVRYLGRLLLPVLVMSVPMLLIFSQLECFYGYAPLEIGKDAVVTMQMKDRLQGPAPALLPPEGIVVESPAIRVDRGRQISWRIRALRPIHSALRFEFPNRTAAETLTKSVQAGIGPQYLSKRRVSSRSDLIWYPSESRLPNGLVDWIEIRYPSATVHGLGLDLPWLVWLLIVSMVVALLLKNRFQVTF
jgi:hypothetical protein